MDFCIESIQRPPQILATTHDNPNQRSYEWRNTNLGKSMEVLMDSENGNIKSDKVPIEILW